MKNQRLKKYLATKKSQMITPFTQKEDVMDHPDSHIDQDFPGFPHGIAKEELINPNTRTQKKTAATDKKDGEKIIDTPAKNKNEGDSDGSANAFEGTESVKE
jgi:hypothetical protein